MIRRPPRSTLSSSSAASDVYKRQLESFLTLGLGVVPEALKIGFVLREANIAGMPFWEAHQPLVPRHRMDDGMALAVFALATAAIGEGPSVTRAVKHPQCL